MTIKTVRGAVQLVVALNFRTFIIAANIHFISDKIILSSVTMSSTSKGWLGSKRRVICSYCGKESRYDNLSRHTISVHGKNTQVKYSVIEPKENVLTLFKTKEKVPTDDLDNTDTHDENNRREESEGAEGDSNLIDLILELTISNVDFRQSRH